VHKHLTYSQIVWNKILVSRTILRDLFHSHYNKKDSSSPVEQFSRLFIASRKMLKGCFCGGGDFLKKSTVQADENPTDPVFEQSLFEKFVTGLVGFFVRRMCQIFGLRSWNPLPLFFVMSMVGFFLFILQNKFIWILRLISPEYICR
jgi:hypothetical protein